MAGTHLGPGSTLKSIIGSLKTNTFEVAVSLQLSNETVNETGNKPFVPYTTLATSKVVADEGVALGPKFHKYCIEAGPVAVPSKS
jgi:hypothetical protein